MGVSFRIRKNLSHSIERQLDLEIHHRTAPEDSLRCNVHLLCLCWGYVHGPGGVPQALKNLCCGLLKETPMALPDIFSTH